MRDNRREAIIRCEGGLDLETPALSVKPGRMLACKNYELNTLGGYTRIEGYERYDGQLSPSDTSDEAEAAVRRAAISKPPGSGPVRGVWVFGGQVFCFRDTSDGTECKMFKESSSGWTEVATPALNPGGTYSFTSNNFHATATAELMLGADGANPAFTFDGTTFTQITVPGETDFPKFLAVVNNYLFLGYETGMVYYSAVGEPADFDPINGAGGFGAGDYLTGLHLTVGGSLVVMMRNRISILYGSGPEDWANKDLRNHDDKVGGVAYSALSYNDLYYLDDRGLTSLQATQAYGNFSSGTISQGVNPFLRDRRGLLTDAVVSGRKNQLRWYFNPIASLTGSEILTATFSGNQLVGYSRQVYNHKLFCVERGELPSGEEIIVAGTEDGWVMRLDKGTSFDGEPIEYYFRFAFAHFGTPQKRKHFLKAIFNIQAAGAVSLRVKPLFNYNDPNSGAHRVDELDIIGGGSAWDEGNWNEFVWSAQVNSEALAEIAGTGRNVAFVIYGNSASERPHTFFDALIYYTLRNWQR
ncbi:hypothetical protein [Hahella ganghwensis]|uniref:hypothetical protein n=1 Tax=Hahella ganghwensis TaxID=286420 RepID=UPI0003736A51|nr:hypothetical protein [Hahella ganghwensis]